MKEKLKEELKENVEENAEGNEVNWGLLSIGAANANVEIDDPDERSVFVKGVDYSAEAEELKEHFKECGEVKRVTILYDKVTQ